MEIELTHVSLFFPLAVESGALMVGVLTIT
jgi:hypothetical protein